MKVGIALSGGGARGIAHLGVIKALEEKGVSIAAISGTSAGAVIGALYAYGYSPDHILTLIQNISFRRNLRPALTRTGLLKIETLRDLFLKYLPENDFGRLKIPMAVAATDINKGETTFFSKGELIMPILASCCVPVLFQPLKYKDGLYVDGGILDNLPVEGVISRSDFIIGCHTNPIDNAFDVKNVKTLIERSLLMAINGNTQKRKDMCDVLIEPPQLGKFTGGDLNKGKELFDIGYEYTIANFEDFNIPTHEAG